MSSIKGKRKQVSTSSQPQATAKDIDDLFDDLKKSKKAKVDDESKKAVTKGAANKSGPEKAGSKAVKESREGKSSSSAQNQKPSTSTTSVARPHGIIQPDNPHYIISPEAPVHRIDEASGLKVYKAHLLKVGDGGGTALCPFDCDCCF